MFHLGKPMNISKNKTGIFIIASYFVVNGSYVSYQLVNAWFQGKPIEYDFIYILIPLIFLVSGIGLFLTKGWGRNLALLSSFCYGFIGLVKILQYFLLQREIADLVKGSTDIILAACILIYLLKKSVKEFFPESPVSSTCIGLAIVLYGSIQHSDIAVINYFWGIMFIIGWAIMFKAGHRLRESMGSLTSE